MIKKSSKTVKVADKRRSMGSKFLCSLCLSGLLLVLFVITASAQQPTLRYPMLGDNPFPTLKGSDLKKARDALKLARSLTKRCECDRALADYGIESLQHLLKMEINLDMFDGRISTLQCAFPGKIDYRETMASFFGKMKDSIAAKVIPETFTGSAKIIFLNSYFFDPTTDVTTGDKQRAIILIHESVHQFAGKGDNYFGGSKALTNKISKKCLPGLNHIKMLGELDYNY